MITVQEFKDKYLGEIGTEVRDRYEQELKVELLAEQIKQLRKERNLIQEQLGELVGVQRAQISKMENNTGNVTVATLIKIFGALKAKVTTSTATVMANKNKKMNTKNLVILLIFFINSSYSQNSVQTNRIIRSSSEKIGVVSNSGSLLIDTNYISIGVPYGKGHKVLPPQDERVKFDSPIEYYVVIDSERKSAIFDKNGNKIFGFVDCFGLEIDDYTKTIVKIIKEQDNSLSSYIYGFDGIQIFEQSFENIGYINNSYLIALIAEDGSNKEYYLYNIKTKTKLGPFTHFNIYNNDSSPPLGVNKNKFEQYTKLNLITNRQKKGKIEVWGACDLNGQELLPSQYQGIVPIINLGWEDRLINHPDKPINVDFYFYTYRTDDYEKMILLDNKMKKYEYDGRANTIKIVE